MVTTTFLTEEEYARRAGERPVGLVTPFHSWTLKDGDQYLWHHVDLRALLLNNDEWVRFYTR